MRRSWFAALLVVGCASSYRAQEADPPATDGGVEAGPGDAGMMLVPDASDGAVADTGADSGDAGDDLPFSAFVVLRFETDAPNGLQSNGAWRDLSKGARSVNLASGTTQVAFSGDAGAKSMVFGPAGPIFDVPDDDELRFGPRDDFFVVARTTIDAPLESENGCTFHYLFAKYDSDGSRGPHVRVCAPTSGRELIGSLALALADAKVAAPLGLASVHQVVSFGRNESGQRIETYAGGTSTEVTLPALVDVSSAGSAFVLGGYRALGTGGPAGPWIGKVNRLYVYHAPAGTFSQRDFATIRSFVKSAAPLP